MAFDLGESLLPPQREYEQAFSDGLNAMLATRQQTDASIASAAMQAKTDRKNARELADAYKRRQRSGGFGVLGDIVSTGVKSFLDPLGAGIAGSLFPEKKA